VELEQEYVKQLGSSM